MHHRRSAYEERVGTAIATLSAVCRISYPDLETVWGPRKSKTGTEFEYGRSRPSAEFDDIS